MKYRGFLSAIIILGLVGTIIVLWQDREGLRSQVGELRRAQEAALSAEEISEPTELVVNEEGSFYQGERITRDSYRCDYGNCLFTGEGGLVGLATVDGFYTTVLQKDFEGNEISCPALYVKRGPAELAQSEKFSRFYGENKGVLVIPLTEEYVSHASDWENFLKSGPNKLIQATVFVRDSLEMGSAPCDGGMYVIDVQSQVL